MINAKTYNRSESKLNYGTEYKYCNVWFNDDKRIIVMNIYGDDPHGAKHPVHWLFDESEEWAIMGKHDSEGDQGPFRIKIVPHNTMSNMRSSRRHLRWTIR